MKIVNPVQPTLVQGIAEDDQKDFSINFNDVAYQILSSDIYSDKVLAVIREVACNAYDAHVMAGTPQKPIVVHLPTTLEPIFYVKDFGPGMTHDQVMRLYSTYFLSTKSDSNDFVGAMGLGSKSPFAYTDMFTVRSVHNGKLNNYSAFKGETGKPRIARMGEEENTDEPSGITVTVPVYEKDINTFANKAGSFFRFFPVTPTFEGNIINVTKPEYLLSGPDWGIIKHGNGHYCNRFDSTNSFAVHGPVAYPIDVRSMNIDRNDPHRASELLGSGLILEFEIGELSIAPSREALSYDQRTIKNIMDKVKIVRESISKDARIKLNGIQTRFEVQLFMQELNSTNRLVYTNIIESDSDGESFVNWRGQRVQLGNIVVAMDLDVNAEPINQRVVVREFSNFTDPRRAETVNPIQSAYDRTTKNYKKFTAFKFRPSEHTHFLFNDSLSKSKGLAVAREYSQQVHAKASGRGVIVYYINENVPDNAGTSNRYSDILTAIEGSKNIVYTSSLPTPTSNAGGKKRKDEPFDLYVIDYHQTRRGWSRSASQAISITKMEQNKQPKEGVYFELRGQNIVRKVKTATNTDGKTVRSIEALSTEQSFEFIQSLHELADLNISKVLKKGDVIYGVRTSEIEKLDSTKWIRATDKLNAELTALITDPSVIEVVKHRNLRKQFEKVFNCSGENYNTRGHQTTLFEFGNWLDKRIVNLPDTNPLVRFTKMTNDVRKGPVGSTKLTAANLDKVANFLQSIGGEVPKTLVANFDVSNVEEIFKEIKALYPMIHNLVINQKTTAYSASHVTKLDFDEGFMVYVEAMDAKNTKK